MPARWVYTDTILFISIALVHSLYTSRRDTGIATEPFRNDRVAAAGAHAMRQQQAAAAATNRTETRLYASLLLKAPAPLCRDFRFESCWDRGSAGPLQGKPQRQHSRGGCKNYQKRVIKCG
jgi:hypothetical protein